MKNRKPLQCSKIHLGDKDYFVDKTNVRYGGTSIIYQIHDANGKHYTLKECYPSKLKDWIIRNDNDELQVAEYSMSGINVPEQFEKFKSLFIAEYSIYYKLKESSEFYRSNNPEILGCDGVFEKNNTIYIILGTLDSRTLTEQIEKWDKKDFNKQDLKKIITTMVGLIERTHSLHKNYNLLHLDICPDNVVIAAKTNTVYLIDFNSALDLSKKTEKYNRAYSARKGYSAVEVEAYSRNYFNYTDLSEKSDSYSIGAILFRIFTGYIISSKDRFSNDWEIIIRKRLSQFDPEISNRIIQIIMKAISCKPNNRYDLLTFRDDIIGFEELIINEPLKLIISNLKNAFSNIKKKLKITRIKLFTTMVLLIVVSGGVLWYNAYLPNIKDRKAQVLLENGNAKKAYELLLEIYDIYYSNPMFHPWYSEADLKYLAWCVYQQRTTETTVAFEDEVCQAVRTSDNRIVALLKNCKIVTNYLSVDNSVKNSFSVPNSEGILSQNGLYYVTLLNDNLEVYLIGNKKIMNIDGVKNFTINGDWLAIVYGDNTLEIVNLDTKESIPISNALVSCSSYKSGTKTLDFMQSKEMVSYIDNDGNVFVLNIKTGEEYKHIPRIGETQLSFVQLSEANGSSTIQVSDLNNVIYEYDYISEQTAYLLTLQNYCYFVSPNNDWYISQKWTSENSLVDRYISIHGNKVQVNLIAMDTSVGMRFMTNDGNAEKEITKLADCGDIDDPFYYDYDRQTKEFYIININTGATRILPLNSNMDFSEIAEFIVHDDSLCITTKNSISFCKIGMNSIEETQRVKPVNANASYDYAFSFDKRMFASVENNVINIYKYDKNEWGLYDTITADDSDSFIYTLKFSNDNKRLCVEYTNKTLQLSKLVFFKDNKKSFERYHTEGVGAWQLEIISSDLTHFYTYETKKDDAYTGHILCFDFDKRTTEDVLEVIDSDSNIFASSSVAIKDRIVAMSAVSLDSNDLLHPRVSISNGKKLITSDAISSPIQVSEKEIAFVERVGNSDNMIIYDINTEKKDRIPLSRYDKNVFPTIYGLWYLKDGYISVSALYINDRDTICINSIIKDYDLDTLMRKCESLYR